MRHQAMFSLCMVESEADEVTLQGVTSVGLKHALDFAYTGQVSLSSSQAQLNRHRISNKDTTVLLTLFFLGGDSWEVLFKKTGAKNT